MSNIVKNIFSKIDKVNFLSNTNNITKLVSNFESFTSNDNNTEDNNYDKTIEEKNEKLCKMIIAIRVLYILTIFVALYYANQKLVISTSLFMGLSILTFAMPDIVIILLILISIVNSKNNNNQEDDYFATVDSYSTKSSDFLLGNTPEPGIEIYRNK